MLRPSPSNSRQMMCEVSTPPWQMKSSTSQPRSFSGSAVTTLARLPQHLRMARATLYSPPPSHTWNWRALRTRPKPGSKRSITSPNETQSHFVIGRRGGSSGHRRPCSTFPRMFLIRAMVSRDLLLDAGIVLGRQQFLGDQVGADAGSRRCRRRTTCVSDSSVGSTPPVGMMRVHGMGPSTFLTNSGPPTRANRGTP